MGALCFTDSAVSTHGTASLEAALHATCNSNFGASTRLQTDRPHLVLAAIQVPDDSAGRRRDAPGGYPRGS